MSFSIAINNYHNEHQQYVNKVRPQLAQAQLVAKRQGKDELKAQITNLLETIHDGHIPLNLQEQLESCKKVFEAIKAHQKPSCFPALDRLISYYTFERPMQQMIDKIAAHIPAPVEMRVVVHKPTVEILVKPVDKRTVGQIAYDELKSQVMKTRDAELFANIMNMPIPIKKEKEAEKASNFFSSLFNNLALVNN